MGCWGGWLDAASEFLIDNGCIRLSEYPYESGDSGFEGDCVTDGMTKLTGIVTDWQYADSGYQGFVDALLD